MTIYGFFLLQKKGKGKEREGGPYLERKENGVFSPLRKVLEGTFLLEGKGEANITQFGLGPRAAAEKKKKEGRGGLGFDKFREKERIGAAQPVACPLRYLALGGGITLIVR